MLFCFDVTARTRGIAPTLAKRAGAEINTMAKQCNITVLGGRPLDADYGELSADVRHSTREAVFSFTEFLNAATVTIQRFDTELFLRSEGPQIIAMVQNNWQVFAGQLTDIPYEEVIPRFREIALTCITAKPEEVAAPADDGWNAMRGHGMSEAEITVERNHEWALAREREQAEAAEDYRRGIDPMFSEF